MGIVVEPFLAGIRASFLCCSEVDSENAQLMPDVNVYFIPLHPFQEYFKVTLLRSTDLHMKNGYCQFCTLS